MRAAELRDLVVSFMVSTERQILAQFRSLGRSVSSKDHYVFIPGARPKESRVVLVAHADTVQGPISSGDLTARGDLVYGSKGCGADDRAGCAALWSMRALGHSLLITTGEEVGGVGAQHAIADIPEELGAHVFALQIDRRGDMDTAFYPGTDSDDFRAYLARMLPGWAQNWGSYTDVASICPEVGICGANLSAGYMWEHTRNEILSISALSRTIAACRKILACADYPHFVPTPVSKRWGGYGVSRREWWEEDSPYHSVSPRTTSGDVAGSGVPDWEGDEDWPLLVDLDGSICGYARHPDPELVDPADGVVYLEDALEWYGSDRLSALEEMGATMWAHPTRDNDNDNDGGEPWD